MRLPLLLLTALVAASSAQAQNDDGFDDRGVDRHDRTPDWNYRGGERPGIGAYYDGGRYGPRGLLRSDELAPWLSEAGAAPQFAKRSPARVNRRFEKLADVNRDARLTDEEIAAALAKVGGRSR